MLTGNTPFPEHLGEAGHPPVNAGRGIDAEHHIALHGVQSQLWERGNAPRALFSWKKKPLGRFGMAAPRPLRFVQTAHLRPGTLPLARNIGKVKDNAERRQVFEQGAARVGCFALAATRAHRVRAQIDREELQRLRRAK